jgi:hypothetical protein
MLVRTDDGAIHEVQSPVELAGRICLLLHGGEDSVPDASQAPPAEATVHR